MLKSGKVKLSNCWMSRMSREQTPIPFAHMAQRFDDILGFATGNMYSTIILQRRNREG
ncbi:hypothetical protein ROBYS_14750 [Roseobacter sp. OBYS 0001]|nr:hypothetical protein ROBYS_14750 [Roseobacter sp. OBYS 0001]